MMCAQMVSVIIAVYNMEKYLDKCISSILNQVYQDFEVIMVNDGSNDSSEKIIDRYVMSNPIKFIKINKENGGLSSARNVAIPVVRGKYITFLDADDYYDRDYLKKLVEKAEAEDLDIVCSGQYKVNEEGTIQKTIRYRYKNGQCLLRRLNISGKLYRVEYIKKWNINFPEGKKYEDNSFNLQAYFLTSRVGFLEYEGYYQVVHEGSITSKPIEYKDLPFEEWERVAKIVHDNAPSDSAKELFDFTFVSFLTYFLMVRIKKREYLPNENHHVSMSSVYEIADRVQSIVVSYFGDFCSNKYHSLLRYKAIPVFQKIGTFVFYTFCMQGRIKKLIKVSYLF